MTSPASWRRLRSRGEEEERSRLPGNPSARTPRRRPESCEGPATLDAEEDHRPCRPHPPPTPTGPVGLVLVGAGPRCRRLPRLAAVARLPARPADLSPLRREAISPARTSAAPRDDHPRPDRRRARRRRPVAGSRERAGQPQVRRDLVGRRPPDRRPARPRPRSTGSRPASTPIRHRTAIPTRGSRSSRPSCRIKTEIQRGSTGWAATKAPTATIDGARTTEPRHRLRQSALDRSRPKIRRNPDSSDRVARSFE